MKNINYFRMKFNHYMLQKINTLIKLVNYHRNYLKLKKIYLKKKTKTIELDFK